MCRLAEGPDIEAKGHEAELARQLWGPARSPARLLPLITTARTTAASPRIWAEMWVTKHVSLWL